MSIGCNQTHALPFADFRRSRPRSSHSAADDRFSFHAGAGPGPPPRQESFLQFFGDLVSLVKRSEVLVAILLFAAPSATFSLTNFLGGRGNDFQALPGFVGLSKASAWPSEESLAVSSLSVTQPPYVTAAPVPYRRDCRRLVHTRTDPAAAHSCLYAIVLIIFQSMAITTSIAVTFETIGLGVHGAYICSSVTKSGRTLEPFELSFLSPRCRPGLALCHR
jgi:hypothetical protein